MKKILIAISTFILLLAAVVVAVGPSYIVNAPGVAAGMAAKLACSGRFVSGFSQQQAALDLESYSPVMALVALKFHEQERWVQADFLTAHKRAHWQPGLGCSLDWVANERDGITVPELPSSEVEWPAGNGVSSIEPQMQRLLDSILQEDNAQGFQTRALLVVQSGHILAESYAPGIDKTTPLLGWSMAKTVTSMAVGRWLTMGQGRLSDSHLFPEWSEDARAQLQLQHLLTMTDGLNFEERYQPGADATRMLFTEPGAGRFARTKSLLHRPGSHFNYSSGTANLLALWLFNQVGATAQATQNFLFNELFIPMGMQKTVFETDSLGVPVGSSYVYAPARDWARLGQLILSQGFINGRQLIASDYVQAACAPNHSENMRAYGFQLWLNRGDESLRWPDLPASACAALGNREQVVMAIPERQLVFVRLGWSASKYPTNARVSQLLEKL